MDFRYEPLTLQFLGFINTPSLFKFENFIGYPSFETERIEISEDTELDLKIPDNLMLGKRIEYFFAWYIQHYSREKIRLQNQVISKDRITVGEVDFILENKYTQELSHIELIYKYYLYDPNFDKEIDKWIGPNRKDTLVRKLDKLKQHQFPLLYREESRKYLEPISRPVEKIVQKICFKANLFVHPGVSVQELPLVNTSAIRGYWIRREDFSEEDYGKYLFYSPEKRNWLINPEYCCTWYSYKEIIEIVDHLLSRQRSPLLWMKKEDDAFEQFFLVWW